MEYCPIGGSPALKRELAEIYGVDPDWIVVKNGATEALWLLVSALSRPNGNVWAPSPGYGGFAGACLSAQLQPRYYRHPAGPFTPQSLQDLLESVDDDTVLLLANSPHNPTGASLRPSDRRALVQALAARGVPLAIDGVFDPFRLGDTGQIPAGLEETIVIGSLSKLLSLPGLRTGWIVDGDENRRARLLRARGYTSLGGSPLLEGLAVHALRHRRVILERVTTIANRNLGELRAFMDKVGDILDWIPPDAGLTAFPRFRDGRDSGDLCKRLADRGVLVVPGGCFGMPAHFRIGFGSQLTGIGPALAIIEQALRAV